MKIPGSRPIGNDACFACHPVKGKVSEQFVTEFYWKTDVHSRIPNLTCETCHGPGRRHERANSPAHIINPAKLDKWQGQMVCSACHLKHEGADLHGGTGVACLDCHILHTTNNAKYLKLLPEPETCYQCHPSSRAEFNLPNRHPVNEGIMKCTSCHLSHFTMARDNLLNTRDVETCGACHTEERGPFVYSHITFEGCKQCHLPHGSSQQNLLTVAQPALCMECHLTSTDQVPFNYPHCTICHVAIHGSNKTRLMHR